MQLYHWRTCRKIAILTESVICKLGSSYKPNKFYHTGADVPFFIIFFSVISRECYQCLSTHSWGDCNDKRIKVQCLGSTRCVKASAHRKSGYTDEAYVKGCAATCSASDLDICRNPNYKCEVSCCSSDYCNGASGPVFSGLLLIVTASFVFLFGGF